MKFLIFSQKFKSFNNYQAQGKILILYCLIYSKLLMLVVLELELKEAKGVKSSWHSYIHVLSNFEKNTQKNMNLGLLCLLPQ